MMRQFLRRGCAYVALVGCGLLCVGLSVAAPLLDGRGREVVAPQAPQRIVSLLPSITETVCVLGACDRLVGVDRHSNWPMEGLRHARKLGGGLDPNIEAIVALNPDVVLLSNSRKVAQRLESLGLRTVVLEPRTQADVQRVLQAVGALLHIPDAEGADKEWRRIQAAVQAAVASLPADIAASKVYFEVSRGPYAAGPSSFIGELLASMGMHNIVPQAMGPFPRLNPEFVVRAQPDVILMGAEGMQAAALYPGWHSLQAVREQRICQFDVASSDILVRPGPRLDQAADIIARCLSDKAPRRSAL